MINNVVLVGRLGNDPEMRYTPSGTAVTNFRLAVNRPPRRDAPEGEEQTDWLNIVTFGKVAENCAQYLDKGSLVGIEGRVQSRSWEGKDGQRRYSVEINARSVQFLESRQEAERRRTAQRDREATTTKAPPVEEDFGPVPEGEDIFGDQ